MPEHGAQQAVSEPAVAEPQVAPALPGPSPLRAQLARSASAMGNQAFGRWAATAGTGTVPSLSAREAWGIQRDPAAPAAPAADTDDDAPEPIEVKGLQFGKDMLDGVIPADGGDLSKTFSTHLGHAAQFGPYSLQVPLFPGIFAGFGAGGAMSAKADASLKLTGTNIASAAFGAAKKQEVTASGDGSASGTIAGSLVAGLKIGIPGVANVGVYGQGTMAFRADGDAHFDGSIKRLRPKGAGGTWGPWTGDIKFNAKIKGALIAEAAGYFEYQVLWIYRDQFGQFKIGKWTLAEAGLDVDGSLGPGRPLQVNIKPWVGPMAQPGVSEVLRARTEAERKQAESLAQAGAAGAPVARKALLARDDEPPSPPPPAGGDPPAAPAPAAAGDPPAAPAPAAAGAPPAAAAPAGDNAALASIAGVGAVGAGPGSVELEGEPKAEDA